MERTKSPKAWLASVAIALTLLGQDPAVGRAQSLPPKPRIVESSATESPPEPSADAPTTSSAASGTPREAPPANSSAPDDLVATLVRRFDDFRREEYVSLRVDARYGTRRGLPDVEVSFGAQKGQRLALTLLVTLLNRSIGTRDCYSRVEVLAGTHPIRPARTVLLSPDDEGHEAFAVSIASADLARLSRAPLRMRVCGVELVLPPSDEVNEMLRRWIAAVRRPLNTGAFEVLERRVFPIDAPTAPSPPPRR